jgi:hypothetical protein
VGKNVVVGPMEQRERFLCYIFVQNQTEREFCPHQSNPSQRGKDGFGEAIDRFADDSGRGPTHRKSAHIRILASFPGEAGSAKGAS